MNVDNENAKRAGLGKSMTTAAAVGDKLWGNVLSNPSNSVLSDVDSSGHRVFSEDKSAEQKKPSTKTTRSSSAESSLGLITNDRIQIIDHCNKG